MGQPVVHFEIVGDNAEKLQSFYADLFYWNVNADNPMKYGIVDREEKLNPEGIGMRGSLVRVGSELQKRLLPRARRGSHDRHVLRPPPQAGRLGPVPTRLGSG